MIDTAPRARNELYAGIVWIFSGISLIAYGTISALHASVPGVEELIRVLSSVDGTFIYLAALVSILVEGLYFVGSFFPGSSLVVLLAILSQAGGPFSFIVTIGIILLGWSAAGAINVCVASIYRSKIRKLESHDHYKINDRVWTTWFPAFRASYEVAQVVEGGRPVKVFLSSLRVRLWASLFMAAVTLIVPLFFDIKEASNREGYATIAIVATISLGVGIVKIRRFLRDEEGRTI